jgi:uncharacterized membrane protein
LRKTESSNERSKLKIVLILLVLFSYPAFIHLSFAFDRPQLISFSWLIVSGAGLAVTIRHGASALSLLFTIVLVSGVALWYWGSGIDLIYLPPILINIALMVLFGRTLLRGSIPLVTRFASLWRGQLDQMVALYTRRVTIAWTIFFALMALESTALALFAPLSIWSLFTNFVNYALTLLFFLVEYQMRFYCLPAHKHMNFRDFCHLVLSTDLRRIAR